ncbi:hypothetical protein GCM10011614_27960 [Novosphingobium colocasiae]|uniref:Uncharacterized protein n=1 Tax=Novosphingobium colocasiae TaxID=1256513 RepID=A0A918PI45_9SPHN|nr:hypothetical protein GCM10011614_27960 [Novosphingobium colocasiae]
MTLSDGDLAAHLADQAGRILLQVRASGMFSGKSLGKVGDQTANQFLVHALREQRMDDGLLSEKEKDNAARTGCGSSIRSTAPENMVRSAPTGQFMSRWR